MSYLDIYDDRQKKQIEWCRLYADKFDHGDIGHNDKLLISALSRQLEIVEEAMEWLLAMANTERFDQEVSDYVKIIARTLNLEGIK